MNIFSIINKKIVLIFILLLVVVFIILILNSSIEKFTTDKYYVNFHHAFELCDKNNGRLPILMNKSAGENSNYNSTIQSYKNEGLDRIWLNMEFDTDTQTASWKTKDGLVPSNFTRWSQIDDQRMNGAINIGDTILDPENNTGILVKITKDDIDETSQEKIDTITIRYPKNNDNSQKEKTWNLNLWANRKIVIDSNKPKIKYDWGNDKKKCVQLDLTNDSDIWRIKDCKSTLDSDKSIPLCVYNQENFTNITDIRNIQENFHDDNIFQATGLSDEYDWYVSKDKLTWTTANERCIKNGKELATIQNIDDENKIINLAIKNNIQEYTPIWIGLKSDTYDGNKHKKPAKWVNNENITYTNYSTTDITQDKYKKGVKWGLVFGKNFKNKTEATWEAFPLGKQANFICKKKKD